MIKKTAHLAFFIVAFLGVSCLSPLFAQSPPKWFLDLETGGVFSGYNDVRIPGDTGTLFSLTDDFSTPSSLFFRFRAGYKFNPRHSVFVLIAPLSLSGSGTVNRPIDFSGASFSSRTPLKSYYRFNSYHVSYRFGLKNGQTWRIGLGITVKIRDAAIRLSGAGLEAEKTNVGFVPLLNFLVEWRFAPAWRLLLDGDAAAAPQGRAEDVLLALAYQKNDKLAFKAGYRILEGGADNDQVYSFALFHYIVVGTTFYF